MRKVISLLMVLMSLSTVYATGTAETSAAEPPLVRVLSGGWFGTNYNEVETTRLLEERFNIKIEYLGPGGFGDDLVQRQQVMMAGRDYPEIMAITSAAIEVEYSNAGALLPLNDYFDEYPNLAAYLPESTWDSLRHNDGNNYIIPTTSAYGDGQLVTQTRVNVYRSDWLEQFGLSVPTTPAEYFEVAVAITKQDPDGNGQDDTYALIGSGGPGQIGVFTGIFGAFGGYNNFWVERDGEAVNLALEPGTKEALLFANRLWQAGVVDPEWITDSRDRGGQKWIEGVGGAIYNHGLMSDMNNLDGFRERFLENNPDGDWVIGPPLVAPGYEDVAHGGGKPSPRGWMRTTIVKDAPHALEALPLLDFVVSQEGRMLYNYGLEGEHYRVRDDGSVDLLASQEEQASFGINLFFLPVVRPATIAHSSAAYQESVKEWESWRIGNLADEFLIPEVGQFNTTLTDYTNDTFVKMIVGETSIEGGFERFIHEFNRRGGNALRDALNDELAKR